MSAWVFAVFRFYRGLRDQDPKASKIHKISIKPECKLDYGLRTFVIITNITASFSVAVKQTQAEEKGPWIVNMDFSLSQHEWNDWQIMDANINDFTPANKSGEMEIAHVADIRGRDNQWRLN